MIFNIPLTQAYFYPDATAITAILRANWSSVTKLIAPNLPSKLDPPSKEYFLSSRQALFGGKSVLEIGSADREDDWKPFLATLALLSAILKGPPKGQGIKGEKTGPFFLGDGSVPSFADFTVVAAMAWFKRSVDSSHHP